ncbi:RNA-binding S4 domain-containing protein [Lentibacillus halophilus]
MNRYEEIAISTDFIPLGQFMKMMNVLDSGGMVKAYLQDIGVLVNDERVYQRGKKLYPGDSVTVDDIGTFVVSKE